METRHYHHSDRHVAPFIPRAFLNTDMLQQQQARTGIELLQTMTRLFAVSENCDAVARVYGTVLECKKYSHICAVQHAFLKYVRAVNRQHV